jgi:hypothetical protein
MTWKLTTKLNALGNLPSPSYFLKPYRFFFQESLVIYPSILLSLSLLLSFRIFTFTLLVLYF